jgi:hypothetical protein
MEVWRVAIYGGDTNRMGYYPVHTIGMVADL